MLCTVNKKQALAETQALKRPAVLAVSGVHNSGKTTLLEKLLPVLRSRGLVGRHQRARTATILPRRARHRQLQI